MFCAIPYSFIGTHNSGEWEYQGRQRVTINCGRFIRVISQSHRGEEEEEEVFESDGDDEI
jgi:hypothetical protein